MSLRFFADHCISTAVIERLRAGGHEVLRPRDHIDCESPDPEVIAEAQNQEAVLLLLNGDLADIVAYPPSRYLGIVALDVHDHPEVVSALLTHLESYIAHHPQPEHYRGKLLIVEPHRIRIRE